MIRRTSYLTALCSGAFCLGILLGGATQLPRVKLTSAYASEAQGTTKHVEPTTAKDPAPPSSKGAAGARCKVTKDCQANMTCVKTGDHKECTVTPVKVPEAPVVT